MGLISGSSYLGPAGRRKARLFLALVWSESLIRLCAASALWSSGSYSLGPGPSAPGTPAPTPVPWAWVWSWVGSEPCWPLVCVVPALSHDGKFSITV